MTCGVFCVALAEEVVSYDGLKSCKCKAGFGSVTGRCRCCDWSTLHLWVCHAHTTLLSPMIVFATVTCLHPREVRDVDKKPADLGNPP